MSDEGSNGSERRRAARFIVSIQANFGVQAPDTRFVPVVRFPGEVTELSQGGMKLRLGHVTPAEYVGLREGAVSCFGHVSLPGARKEVQLGGPVVWISRDTRDGGLELEVGVQFGQIDETSRSALVKALEVLENASADASARE